MAKAVKFRNQLRKAVSHRRIFNVENLMLQVMKRSRSDSQAAELFHELAEVLEPPACVTPQCPSYGGPAYFCACKKGRIPGHCSEHHRLRRRQRLRQLAIITPHTRKPA